MTDFAAIDFETAFDELAIDSKYFDKFKEVVERSYLEQQRDYPDDDEEESNADVSIRFSKEFMEYYVAEEEYRSYREAYDAIEEKEDREKELDIHVALTSTDPLFRKRYKYMFTETIGDPKEATENYCNNYRGMIALGKSEFYAHAYADYHDEYKEDICVVYAQAYELAMKNGMDDGDAYCFGNTCIEAVDHGIWLSKNEFLKLYHEEWQKDFYFTLIKQDFEKTEQRKMSVK